MLGISHLDESTVTINWLKPVDFVLSYNFTLMRNDVGVVEEGMTLEQSVSFSNLRQLTYYTLTVEAVMNSTLKLPLVNRTTFRTGENVNVRRHQICLWNSSNQSSNCVCCVQIHAHMPVSITYICLYVLYIQCTQCMDTYKGLLWCMWRPC